MTCPSGRVSTVCRIDPTLLGTAWMVFFVLLLIYILFLFQIYGSYLAYRMSVS